MTATLSTVTARSTDSAAPALWRTGLLATVLAAAATEAWTGIVRATGVHLAAGDIGGSSADVVEIGPGACTIMVAMCMVAGLLLAAGIRRFAARPARTWTVTAYALTVVSFVPDVFAGATATSTKLTLMAAHVIAAVIVVPIVARSLKTQR